MNRKAYFGKVRSECYSGNAWHFKQFVRGEYDSLPFDSKHDSIVYYHGGSLSDFYTEEKTPENSPQKKSIFNTEAKKPENGFQVGGKAKIKDFTYKHDGIFGGTLLTGFVYANGYQKPKKDSHGLIYEIELPQKSAIMIIGDKYTEKWLNISIPSSGESYYSLRSSEDIIRLLGGKNNDRELAVQNLRKLIKHTVSNIATNGANLYQADQVQLGTPHKIEKHHITGYWPLKYSKKPFFFKYKNFADWIYRQKDLQDRLPEPNKTRGIKNKQKKSLKELEKLRENLTHIENTSYNIEHKVRKCLVLIQDIYEHESSKNRKFKFLIRKSWYEKFKGGKIHDPYRELKKRLWKNRNSLLYTLEVYNNVMDSVLKFNEEYVEANVERKHVGTLVQLEYLVDSNSDIGEHDGNFNSLFTGLIRAIETREKEEKKILESSSKKNFEKETKRVFEQVLGKIPDLKPLEQNLRNMEPDDFIKKNIEELESAS